MSTELDIIVSMEIRGRVSLESPTLPCFRNQICGKFLLKIRHAERSCDFPVPICFPTFLEHRSCPDHWADHGTQSFDSGKRHWLGGGSWDYFLWKFYTAVSLLGFNNILSFFEKVVVNSMNAISAFIFNSYGTLYSNSEC